MPPKRAHILLPEELIREIDALVGPRGRSSFLVETARNEVRRQKLLAFLEGGNPGRKTPENDAAWKDRDHPELRSGSAAWVRKIRAGSEMRLKRPRN